MNLKAITPLILTYNEEANISRTLDRLHWAERIVVVDSYSTDSTLDILSSYESVEVYQRTFDHFADQCNFGLEQIKTGWTLSLDADYVLSQSFLSELQALTPAADGYAAVFTYCIFGKPLRGNLYPPRTVLYKTSRASYDRDGHAHRVKVGSSIGKLHSPIYHDDRKPLFSWLDAQKRYAKIEAEKLEAQSSNALGAADRLRKTGLAPFAVPLYCLIRKRLILDGEAGLYYTMQRTYAEALLALYILDNRLRG